METIHYQGVVLTFSADNIFHNPMQYLFGLFAWTEPFKVRGHGEEVIF